MKIENIEVFGFRSALRGMRNPLESWVKSDSIFGTEIQSPYTNLDCYGTLFDPEKIPKKPWDLQVNVPECPWIGPKDLELAKKLIKAGGDHRKFLRQICIWWDITIPRALWQELDTYKISTVRNSCSTMHKLGSRDLELSDFQDGIIDIRQLNLINELGVTYRESKTPDNLHRLKMHLPESFLQKATYTFNYEVAYRMYFSRKDHRMPEWSGPNGICSYLIKLPYFQEFVIS